MKRYVVITRYVRAEAWRHVPGKEEARARCYELVPGQRVRVLDQDGDCLQLPRGWAVIPEDAYEMAT